MFKKAQKVIAAPYVKAVLQIHSVDSFCVLTVTHSHMETLKVKYTFSKYPFKCCVNGLLLFNNDKSWRLFRQQLNH